MLKLKPNCECCDRDLPPDSAEARICTFECTFCATCADAVFGGQCPNCGGNLVARPVRPAAMLAKYPAATERTLREAPCGTGAAESGRTLSPLRRPCGPQPKHRSQAVVMMSGPEA